MCIRAKLVLEQAQASLMVLIAKLEVDKNVMAHIATLAEESSCDPVHARIRRVHAAVRKAYPSVQETRRSVASATDKRGKVRNSYTTALSALFGAQHAVAQGQLTNINVAAAEAEVERYVFLLLV